MINSSTHSLDCPDSPLKMNYRSTFISCKRVNTPFITDKPEAKSNETIIAENFERLNFYIDSLDPKIKKIVEHNEA